VKHGEGNTNSPELSLLKFLPLAYHQAIFGHHLGFHIFFHNGLLGGHTLLLDLMYVHNEYNFGDLVVALHELKSLFILSTRSDLQHVLKCSQLMF